MTLETAAGGCCFPSFPTVRFVVLVCFSQINWRYEYLMLWLHFTPVYSDQVTTLFYHFLSPAGPWEPFVAKWMITSSPLPGSVAYYTYVKIILACISCSFSRNCSFSKVTIDAPDQCHNLNYLYISPSVPIMGKFFKIRDYTLFIFEISMFSAEPNT